jgi:hypothetical protein
MKPKFDMVLHLAIEQGINFGIDRAFKHSNEKISNEQIEILKSNLELEISAAMHEYFDFEPMYQK